MRRILSQLEMSYSSSHKLNTSRHAHTNPNHTNHSLDTPDPTHTLPITHSTHFLYALHTFPTHTLHTPHTHTDTTHYKEAKVLVVCVHCTLKDVNWQSGGSLSSSSHNNPLPLRTPTTTLIPTMLWWTNNYNPTTVYWNTNDAVRRYFYECLMILSWTSTSFMIIFHKILYDNYNL